jgi:hypothetical protein
MSVLLFGVGAFAVVVGAVLVAFGIPINEFSFGNTLILAGTIAFVGGLIVVGLGVVVSQLQRLAEAMSTRAPIKSSRGLDMFEPTAGSRAAPSRVAFPPKPKVDAGAFEPHPPANTMPEEGSMGSYAPTLRNPDEAPVTVEDDVSLSPQHPMTTPAPAPETFDEPMRQSPVFDFNESEMPEKRQPARSESRQEPRLQEPRLDTGWRPAAPAPAPTRQTAYFDAMWPAEGQPAKSPADAKPYEPKFEPPPREVIAPAKLDAPPQRLEPRAVAILKSGVVDGMGYTLYVDGSIEAELPQGTLRFASINELRSHLEKNA